MDTSTHRMVAQKTAAKVSSMLVWYRAVPSMLLFLILSKTLALLASFSYEDALRIFPYTRSYMNLAMPQYDLLQNDAYHRFHCIVAHDDGHGFNFYFHRNRILVGVLWAPRADKVTCFAELREWFEDHFHPLPLAATLTAADDVVAWHESGG